MVVNCQYFLQKIFPVTYTFSHTTHFLFPFSLHLKFKLLITQVHVEFKKIQSWWVIRTNDKFYYVIFYYNILIKGTYNTTKKSCLWPIGISFGLLFISSFFVIYNKQKTSQQEKYDIKYNHCYWNLLIIINNQLIRYQISKISECSCAVRGGTMYLNDNLWMLKL